MYRRARSGGVELPPAAVAIGFNELLDRRILREAGSRSGYDYVFTHHLISAASTAASNPVCGRSATTG